MGKTLVYPKRPSNTHNRNKDRGTYDLFTIHSIINTTQVLHVSFNIENDPFPAILPMIGQMGSFDRPSADEDEPLDCYLHGYVSSRMMNLARGAIDGNGNGGGLPVCISASKLDGLVLSLTPNTHSYNYRSAILHGYATPVTDPSEKLYAMRLITDSVIPNRWINTRTPPDGPEMESTTILKVRVVDGSGKIRDGGVSDEKKDREDEGVKGRVWTGVVPVWEAFGEPVRCGEGRGSNVPGYVGGFVDRMNRENRAYAEGAVLKKQ